MKSAKLSLLFLCLCFCCGITAQMQDTVLLESVDIIGFKTKYSPGSKIDVFTSEKLDQISSGNLSDVLSKNTSLYIKSYAAGLSTISFRGTSANHTQIYFEGETFNSFTLGHSNISDIPVFFFDYVQVQYGGASSLYGSGAIGGSIHLSSVPSWKLGSSILLEQDFASFRSSFSGIKYRWSNRKVESSTKVFYKSALNNFTFRNSAFKNFETGEFYKQTQKNNAVENYGILQELYFKTGSKSNLSLKYYFAHNWHEVQPTMSSNLHGGAYTQIFDRNQRLMLGYSFSGPFGGLFKSKLSYGSDFELYNRTDIIASKRFTGNFEYELHVGDNGWLNVGGHFANITPHVHSYLVDVNEDRTDLFVSYVQSVFKNTRLSLNLRNAYVTDYKPEWAPSIGVHHRFNMNDIQSFNWKISASHSYKVPTFNNRYWGTWGNPDLKTEKGLNLESSLAYQYINIGRQIHSEVTFFNMIVDDWIQWVPVSLDKWMPVNFKKVHSRGIEWFSRFKESFGKCNLSLDIRNSFTLSTPVEVYGDDLSELNRQISYSPKFTFLMNGGLEIQQWRFMVDANFTGARNNSTFDRVLSSYVLFNFSSGYHIQMEKSTFDITFDLKNILNTQYINIENYAMPGLNGRLSVKYKFN